jgi:hypothetical protein
MVCLKTNLRARTEFVIDETKIASFCVCVLSLVTRRTNKTSILGGMLFSSVARLVLPYLFALSHKENDFRKHLISYTKFLLRFLQYFSRKLSI